MTRFKGIPFYSKYMVPFSAGIDAFCVDWKQYLSWIVPPLSSVPKPICYLESCKAKCTLIVPKWESATYWPLLVDSSSGKFKYFIRQDSKVLHSNTRPLPST